MFRPTLLIKMFNLLSVYVQQFKALQSNNIASNKENNSTHKIQFYKFDDGKSR